MTFGFDIVGDLHGHLALLHKLCKALGYGYPLQPPPNRKLVFVGDLATRGPDNLAAICAVREAVLGGRAYAVLGNHDDALLRRLAGIRKEHSQKFEGLEQEIATSPNSHCLTSQLISFLEQLPIVLRLDENRLVVVHAGIEGSMLAHPLSEQDRRFILNGDAIGKSPEGKTLRRDWAAQYNGEPFVVYGHTPEDIAEIRHKSINVDTGVYRSGRLTAFRWPERDVVSVTA